jgi:hypothetical protein
MQYAILAQNKLDLIYLPTGQPTGRVFRETRPQI